MTCGQNIERKEVSSFEFRVSSFRFQGFRVSRFQRPFAPATFAALTALPLGCSPRLAWERALFPPFGFQRSFSLADFGFLRYWVLSFAQNPSGKTKPPSDLSPRRLATLVAALLSQETSGASVCRVTRQRDFEYSKSPSADDRFDMIGPALDE